MKRSRGEQALMLQITHDDLPEPEREYRWAAHEVGLGPGLRQRLEDRGLKDWRFDFAWPDHALAVEVEGGTWSKGRHVRGRGYAADCEKYNAAQYYRWTVLRFTTEQVLEGRAVRMIGRFMWDRALGGRL